MAIHNDVGHWGEQIACEKLIREGYAIVERNWRMHHFEVDIIATKGNRIIFIEVKTRTNLNDDPILAVDKRKINHMIRSAIMYVKYTNTKLEPQFDIIGITGTHDDFKIEHIEDAFIPPLRTYR